MNHSNAAKGMIAQIHYTARLAEDKTAPLWFSLTTLLTCHDNHGSSVNTWSGSGVLQNVLGDHKFRKWPSWLKLVHFSVYLMHCAVWVAEVNLSLFFSQTVSYVIFISRYRYYLYQTVS